MISTIQTGPLYQNEEFLRDLYIEKGLSIRQIAAKCGSARESILYALKRYGIKQTSRLNCGQIEYGKKLKQGRVLSDPNEAQVIKKILNLRASGYSYWAIADRLTSEKWPTKNKVRSWSSATIYKIVQRNKNQSQERSLRIVSSKTFEEE